MFSINGLASGAQRLGLLLVIALAAGAPALGPMTAVPAGAQASPVASPAATPAVAEEVTITGLVTSPGPLTLADLQRLPTETVEVSYESGGAPEEHTFTGVRLLDVLNAAGLAVDADARNPLLAICVVVTAKDGYQVVISGGELDPNFGNVPMLLAWEADGAPLSSEDGPLRLVVPGDLRGGRYVWGIVGIDVRGVAEPEA